MDFFCTFIIAGLFSAIKNNKYCILFGHKIDIIQ